MAFYKLLSMVAFASVLLLDQTAGVHACSCAGQGTLCGYVGYSDIVVHGTVRSRSEQVEIYDAVNYTIDVITIYKGQSDSTIALEIEVTTAGNSASCGAELDLDEEYLLGIYQEGAELSIGFCGLVEIWSSVSDEDEATLEDGCDDDLCDGACDDYQECLRYQGNGNWYCSDTCDNDPCATDEQCKTRARLWCRDSGEAGCPRNRRCL